MIDQAGLDGADDDGLDFPFGQERTGEEAMAGNSNALGDRVRQRQRETLVVTSDIGEPFVPSLIL